MEKVSTEALAIYFLVEVEGIKDTEEAIRLADTVFLYEGSLEYLAEDLVEQGDVDFVPYFNLEAYAEGVGLPFDAYDDEGNVVWDEGEVLTYAEEVARGDMMRNLNAYIDYSSIERSLAREGYSEFKFGGNTYVGRTD